MSLIHTTTLQTRMPPVPLIPELTFIFAPYFHVQETLTLVPIAVSTTPPSHAKKSSGNKLCLICPNKAMTRRAINKVPPEGE